eukprot:8322061-Pyramimonas_sp.AAC.1
MSDGVVGIAELQGMLTAALQHRVPQQPQAWREPQRGAVNPQEGRQWHESQLLQQHQQWEQWHELQRE